MKYLITDILYLIYLQIDVHMKLSKRKFNIIHTTCIKY